MILFRALIRKPAISIAFIFFIAFLIYRSAIYLLGLERANFISWPQNAQSSNEEKRNMISSKQMPLVIVTAYQNMQAMAGRTIRDREEYSGLWGYESEVWRLKDNEKWWKSPVVQVVESGMVVDAIAIPEESRTVTWVKIPALLRAFQKRPNGTAWFWWLDSDAVITNPLRRVRERVLSELAEGVTQDVSDAKPDLVISKDCNGLLNAGSFFIRNTPFAYSLLLTIWHSPLRHTTPKAEQGVLQRLYNGAIPSFRIPKNKIKIVPQREINSFLEGACMPRASTYGKGSLGLSEVQVQILKHNAPSVASKDSAKTGDVGRSRIDLETRDGVWQPGDLVLHIAGCWTRGSHWHGNCHDEFNQAWRERERGWKDVSRLGLSRSM